MHAVILTALTLFGAAGLPEPDSCALFDAAIPKTVGSSPHGMTAADFNEDGVLDLAVVNQSSHSVSILLGQETGGLGNGSFETPQTMAAGQYPLDVVAADFNEDGILDLAVTIQLNIAIFFGRGGGGQGNGSFDPPVLIAYDFRPRGLITADFNEDGIADLAVTNGAGTTIDIFLGLGTDGVGNGGFAAKTINFSGLAPVRVKAADFNEDGILDLVATNNHPTSNDVTILLGKGQGGRGNGLFDPAEDYLAGTAPLGIAVADFNDDSILDIAITNAGSNDVTFLQGQGSFGVGDGTFAADTTLAIGSAPREIVAGDFDADGDTDLAVASGSGNVVILSGNSPGGTADGTFTIGPSFPVGTSPLGIRAGDFVQDGVPDLVTTNAGSSSISVLPGGCSPVPPPLLAITSPGGAVSWGVNSEQTIEWSKSPSIRLVSIDVSRDGGDNWETIATDLPDTCFAWSVSPFQTNEALIRVRDSGSMGRFDVSGTFSISSPVGVPEGRPAIVPAAAWPNPFDDRILFSLTLPSAGEIEADVFDVQGRLVRRLEAGARPAGELLIGWDGLAGDGVQAPPGIYFIRARGAGVIASLKVVRAGS